MRDRGRRFRHRLCEPRLSDLAAARLDQDRPRPDRRHRRRRARPDRRQGDDPSRPRAWTSRSSSKASKAPAQLALLAEWGCDLYQGFLGAGALTQEELTRFVAAAQRRGRLGRFQSFFVSPAAATRASPRESCSAPLSRASGVGQSRDDGHLAVGPKLGRALQPLDVAEQPGKIGEAAFGEGDDRALGPDVELGDHRLAAVQLHLDDLHQVCGFLRKRAEAVDQLGRERVDRLAVLELAEAAVQAHAQVEVGDIVSRGS